MARAHSNQPAMANGSPDRQRMRIDLGQQQTIRTSGGLFFGGPHSADRCAVTKLIPSSHHLIIPSTWPKAGQNRRALAIRRTLPCYFGWPGNRVGGRPQRIEQTKHVIDAKGTDRLTGRRCALKVLDWCTSLYVLIMPWVCRRILITTLQDLPIGVENQ